MSCDRFTAKRRLISLYLERIGQHGSDCAVTLSDVLHVENVDVAGLDLLVEYDGKPYRDMLRQHGWDEHRARELVRRWLHERPASTHKRGGLQ
jgi:hypothetical protein